MANVPTQSYIHGQTSIKNLSRNTGKQRTQQSLSDTEFLFLLDCILLGFLFFTFNSLFLNFLSLFLQHSNKYPHDQCFETSLHNLYLSTRIWFNESWSQGELGPMRAGVNEN